MPLKGIYETEGTSFLNPMAERQTFNISFYCFEKDARKKTGLAPVKACIIINGQRTYCQLQRQYDPGEYKRAMAERGENEIKKYINQQRQLFNQYADEMQAEGYELTADRLKEFFKRGGVRKEYTLGDMFGEYTGYVEEKFRNGEIRDRRTLSRHYMTEKLFYELTGTTQDTAVSRITTTDLKRYESGVLKRYQKSTAAGYLKKIKTFFKHAFDNGKIKRNPASLIRVEAGADPDRIKYLTQEQLDQIRKTEYKANYVRRTADVYLFCCYTGLAYVDFRNLTPESFLKQPDGTIYIKGHRQKTGVAFTTILFKDAKRIAIKYDFQLPTSVSRTNYNKFLKKVAEEAHIDTPPLTAHTARHTFAVFIMNARDANGKPIPDETIMKMCGWTNAAQMRQYAKLLDDSVFKDTSFIEHNTAKGNKIRASYNTAETKPRKGKKTKKAKDTMTIDATIEQMDISD